jgi:Na+/H+ antiporter NhaD/arsenite permease-like protein
MINILVASVIFITSFVFFALGKPHRVIVAMVGAAAMMIAGMSLGFYTQEEALKAIDFNTIGLLAGMMVIVGVLRGTGFFRYLAIKGAKLAKGDPWKLLLSLGLLTAVISMLIDNVTTILLVAPVTMLISDILGINPLPILLAEVLLSNIGGVGTLVGDPPNIIIGSAAGFSFNSVAIHLMPVVLLVMGISLLTLRFIYGKALVHRSKNIERVVQMKAEEAVKDKRTLAKCLLALGVVLVLFILETRLNLKTAFIAFLGAAFTLAMVRPDLKKTFDQVEWPVLAFFVGLFIIVGGLDETGVLRIMGHQLGLFSNNPILTTLVIIWVSAIFCSFVNNIAYTVAMVPVIRHIAITGMNVNPLWWGLALGAGFGGNGTPVGSAAGVVIMSLSEKSARPITFANWLKSGVTVTLVTCGMASLMMAVFFGWFK